MLEHKELRIEHAIEGVYSFLEGEPKKAFLAALQENDYQDWGGLEATDEAWEKGFSRAVAANDYFLLSALGAFAKSSGAIDRILQTKNKIALYGFLQHNAFLEREREKNLVEQLSSLNDIVLTSLALENFLWSQEGYFEALELFREILSGYPRGVSCPIGRYPELYEYDFLKFSQFPLRGERQAWRLNVLARLSQHQVELPSRYRNLYGEMLSIACARGFKTKAALLLAGAIAPSLLNAKSTPATIQALSGQELFYSGAMYQMRRFISPGDYGYLDEFRRALIDSRVRELKFLLGSVEGKVGVDSPAAQELRSLGDNVNNWKIFIELLRATEGDLETALKLRAVMELSSDERIA